jgi:hypothetical protein
MKITVLYLCSVLLAIGATAQIPANTWARQFSSNSGAITTVPLSSNGSGTIAVDAQGNVYTMGTFSGIMDFDPGPGTTYLDAAEGSLFISKFDATGTFVWAKNFGDTAKMTGYAMVANPAGDLYITGTFAGTADLDPGPGVDSVTSGGNPLSYLPNLFVSEISPSGNLVWARTVTDPGGSIYGLSIAIDAVGSVYTMGYFVGTTTDFDPGPDTLALNDSLGSIFILKLNRTGGFVWARNMAGSLAAENLTAGIAVSTTGDIYAASNYQGTAFFDPGTDTVSMTAIGGYDVFVSKLDTSGHLIWARSMGGPADDFAVSLTVDGQGSVYTTGYFSFSGDFDPGVDTFTLTADHNTNHDIFISRLDASGKFVWAKSIGSDEEDRAVSIVMDVAEDLYLTGDFGDDINLDLLSGGHQLPILGSNDGFILKLDRAANYIWVKHTGGPSDNGISSTAVDASYNVYAAGPLLGQVYIDAGVDTATIQSSLPGSFFIYKTGQTDTSATAGIMTLAGTKDILLYPNPTGGKINMILPAGTDGSTIYVYDLLGEEVQSLPVRGTYNTLDISAEASGLYFVKIMHGSELITTQKIVKE